jgi:hypothetical protein
LLQRRVINELFRRRWALTQVGAHPGLPGAPMNLARQKYEQLQAEPAFSSSSASTNLSSVIDPLVLQVEVVATPPYPTGPMATSTHRRPSLRTDAKTPPRAWTLTPYRNITANCTCTNGLTEVKRSMILSCR